jgi:hypothetical protein
MSQLQLSIRNFSSLTGVEAAVKWSAPGLAVGYKKGWEK